MENQKTTAENLQVWAWRSYDHLDGHLNSKLDRTDDSITKGQSRLYCWEDFRVLELYSRLALTQWWHLPVFMKLYAADRKRLDQIIMKASSVLGCSLDPVQLVGERWLYTLENESQLLQGQTPSLQVCDGAELQVLPVDPTPNWTIHLYESLISYVFLLYYYFYFYISISWPISWAAIPI